MSEVVFCDGPGNTRTATLEALISVGEWLPVYLTIRIDDQLRELLPNRSDEERTEFVLANSDKLITESIRDCPWQLSDAKWDIFFHSYVRIGRAGERTATCQPLVLVEDPVG